MVDEEIKYGKTVFYSSVNVVDTFPAREGITLVYTYGSKLLQSKSQRLESLAGSHGLLALVQTTRLTGGYDLSSGLFFDLFSRFSSRFWMRCFFMSSRFAFLKAALRYALGRKGDILKSTR